ncbi:MAG: immunoglobulin domain-containing protein [Verrucomicrobiales bacterium]|nr:immunoglobulin domain-containing protein [Verrucomicrobiales bacterium]
MKTLLALAVVLTTCAAPAALFYSSSINYPAGNLGTVGSSDGWSGSTSGVTVEEGSLDGVPLGLPASTGNKITLTTASSSGTYNPFNTGIRTGAVYYSFLLRVNSTSGLDANGKVVTGLLRAGSASSYYVDVWLRLNGANVEIGVSKLRAGVTWHSAPLAVGQTYLVVVKYLFVTGSNNDVVSFWLNPATGGSEPPADLAISTGGDGNDSTGIGRCYFYGGTSTSADELRIGSEWADVTPSGGTPPPPVPRIDQVFLTPEGVVVRGSNGPANGAFQLVAATSVLLPLSQWSVVATGTFNSAGECVMTNAIVPGLTQQFFALRLSGVTLVPPQITLHPTNQTVLVGGTAVLAAAATGSAPLSWQWFFNGAPLTAATSATLTLTNAQPAHAGNYFAVVSNPVGSATSQVATLTVTNLMLPPSILSQPQSLAVNEGQTAIFSVTATGTPPLRFQWFFNTNTPLAGATNATLTLSAVTTNDAGAYSVRVTNDYGTALSGFAFLTVLPPSSNTVDFSHVGFAANGMPITGGAAGPVVYVGSASQLEAYSDVNPPYTIYITNSFNLSGMSTHIRNNKTVIGVGNVVLTGGGLYLYRATNVIIRNLTIRNSTEDGIGLHYSANVWIDHCTIMDCADGAIDITQQSDNITISWCRFTYTSAAPGNHNYVSLIAASDADTGNYRVTYHHNWWDVNCIERMPSVRFGRAHIFNNYYNAPGNNYCVRTRKQAECRVENNFFQNVRNPWEQYITSFGDVQGKLFAAGNNVAFLQSAFGVTWTGNITNNDGTVRMMIPGTNVVFTPPYSYTLDPVANVPALVTNFAGAGKGPFAP